jgi:hypothetical protein
VLVPQDIDLSPEDHRRQGLLRALSERLRLLRRIDAAEADLVLLAVGIEHRDRIAVRDAHHDAGQVSADAPMLTISSDARITRFLM